MVVEIPPADFLHPHAHSRITTTFQLALFLANLLRGVDDHATANYAASQVWREPGRVVPVDEIPAGSVLVDPGMGVVLFGSWFKGRDELE